VGIALVRPTQRAQYGRAVLMTCRSTHIDKSPYCPGPDGKVDVQDFHGIVLCHAQIQTFV